MPRKEKKKKQRRQKKEITGLAALFKKAFFFLLLIQQSQARTLYLDRTRSHGSLQLTQPTTHSAVSPATIFDLVTQHNITLSVYHKNHETSLGPIRKLISEGYYLEAIDQWEKAIARNKLPFSLHAYEAYSRALMYCGMFDKSKEITDKIISNAKQLGISAEDIPYFVERLEEVQQVKQKNQNIKPLSAYSDNIADEMMWGILLEYAYPVPSGKSGTLSRTRRWILRARFPKAKAAKLERQYDELSNLEKRGLSDPHSVKLKLKIADKLISELPEDDPYFNTLLKELFISKAHAEKFLSQLEVAKHSFETAAAIWCYNQ